MRPPAGETPIHSIQELLGHSDVRTTEIYTQLAKAMRGEITSPLDDLLSERREKKRSRFRIFEPHFGQLKSHCGGWSSRFSVCFSKQSGLGEDISTQRAQASCPIPWSWEFFNRRFSPMIADQ